MFLSIFWMIYFYYNGYDDGAQTKVFKNAETETNKPVSLSIEI